MHAAHLLESHIMQNYQYQVHCHYMDMPASQPCSSTYNCQHYSTADGTRKSSCFTIGVRANIHLGGQTQFCPIGHEQIFCLLPGRINVISARNGGSTAPPPEPRPIHLCVLQNHTPTRTVQPPHTSHHPLGTVNTTR